MADRPAREVPKFRQIADDLRAAIQAGEYEPGDRLPTKAVLQERYGVAVNTVERAIEELRRLRLARTEQGTGTFVTDPGESDEQMIRRLATGLEDAVHRLDKLEERLSTAERMLRQDGQ
jgi:GntR family transcriptional regulator